FAEKKATLIAGTGFQYGDDELVEYGERLYAGFAKQLLYGSGPVSLGNALIDAKQDYLASTPDIRVLHAKSILEATLFGLPMLSVDMPHGRIPAPTTSSPISPTTVSGPAASLGLQSADKLLTTPTSTGSPAASHGTYLSGQNGIA